MSRGRPFHSLFLLVVGVSMVASACGGGATGVTPPSGPGAVSGTTVVAAGVATALAVGRSLPRARGVKTLRGLPVYVPDEVLVKFRPTVQAQDANSLHASAGARLLKAIPRIDVHAVKLGVGTSVQSALATYRSSPLVQYAEQSAYAYALATPNDQFYPLQWHYPKINLPAAWDVTTGAPVIVAVVDTGIRFDHQDLQGVTVQGYDFIDNDSDPTDPGCSTAPDEVSHGTHVSGTVAALTNNSTGVAGVNWGGASGVKVMPVRVLDGCGSGTAAAIASGIISAADNGAKVINLSLRFLASPQAIQDAVNYAYNRDVTLVAAAGNDNGPVGYPAAYPNVIAVAAIACDNTKASYSNFGPEISVAAPGGDTPDCDGDGSPDWVLSTWWSPNLSSGNYYGYEQGTSMAAPHVSGVAALLISRGIVGPSAIRNRLQQTATDLGATGWDQYFGWGLVNAAAAVGVTNTPTAMRAFIGTITGLSITRQSDIVQVNAAGGFAITNAQAGTSSVFAWQDFNGNSVIDAGDVYGRTDNVVVNPGSTTTGVIVTVRRYTGSPIQP